MCKKLMPTIFRSLLISLVCVAASHSHAADWIRFATDKAGALHEVDRTTLRKENGLVYVWRKRTFREQQTLNGMVFSSEISKMAFKCDAPFGIASVQMTFYDSQGKHVDGHTFSTVKFSEPVPDSIGDVSRKFVCDLSAPTVALQQKDNDAEQTWFATVEKFKVSVRDHEGIDYDTNRAWSDAWDSEIKRLSRQPENSNKTATWFLEQAHKNVKLHFAKK